MEEEQYHEFPLPEGFTMPEGASNDQEFDILSTVKVKPDGKTMCLTKVAGIPVPKKSNPLTEMMSSTGKGMLQAYRGGSVDEPKGIPWNTGE